MFIVTAMMIFSSTSAEETEIFASNLAKILLQTKEPICLALNGTLGAGKTCFTKGLARGLGISEEVVSPSFAILHDYEGEIDLLHSDFYRLEEEDLINLGLEEQIEDFDGVVVIEWAEKFSELLPLEYLNIQISIQDESRIWEVRANGEGLEPILERWKHTLEGE